MRQYIIVTSKLEQMIKMKIMTSTIMAASIGLGAY